MTYDVRLQVNAQRDFDRARAWYDVESPDQLDRFIDEFFATARRLQEFPHSAPAVRGSVRRVGLNIFPYHFWYRVRDEAKIVEVIAVLHHRQDPARMDERLR